MRIVSVDVDGVVEPPGPGAPSEPQNSNLELEPGVSPPESKTGRLFCQRQAILVCCLTTVYCFIAFK